MARRFLIVALALGAVFGFASGFRHLGCAAHAHHADLEEHWAGVCARAAERVYDGHAARPPGPR